MGYATSTILSETKRLVHTNFVAYLRAHSERYAKRKDRQHSSNSVVEKGSHAIANEVIEDSNDMPTAVELIAGESTHPSTADDKDTLETGVSSQTDMTSARLKELCQGYISENVKASG